MDELLKDAVLNPPASEAAIRSAASALGISLPSDYEEFLRRHNGAEGFAGSNSVVLFKDLCRSEDGMNWTVLHPIATPS